MCSDKFFSSVVSVRNFSCFQLFTFKSSKFTKSKLMSRDSQAPEKYEDIIRHYSVSNKTVIDDAVVCTGRRWTKINRKYCILWCSYIEVSSWFGEGGVDAFQ